MHDTTNTNTDHTTDSLRAWLRRVPLRCRLGFHDWHDRWAFGPDRPTPSEGGKAAPASVGETVAAMQRNHDLYREGEPVRVTACARCDVLHHRRLLRDDDHTIDRPKYLTTGWWTRDRAYGTAATRDADAQEARVDGG